MIFALGARLRALTEQSPLLQITQMVLADSGIETAKVPETIRTDRSFEV